jgi:hypothetical protein
MCDAIKTEKARLTKYRMPNLRKTVLTLTILIIATSGKGQSKIESLELSIGRSQTNQPVSLQQSLAELYLKQQLGPYGEQDRTIIPSAAIVFELKGLTTAHTSSNFLNELSYFYSIGFQLEKRLSYIGREEILVDVDEQDPKVTYHQYDRTTIRVFENLNALKLGGGMVYIHHLDRSWNINIRSAVQIGLPIQNNLVAGKDLRREIEAISENGKKKEVVYQSLTTNKLRQNTFILVQPQLQLGVDFKPFEQRMVFINFSYASSASMYKQKTGKEMDYNSGFWFGVRSQIISN